MRSLVLAAIVCTVVGSTWVLAEDAVPAKPANQEVFTFSVGDLPVWSKDGQFQPALLMEILNKSVNDPSVEIMPFPANASLIVNAHREAQDKVKETLTKLRKPTEAPKK